MKAPKWITAAFVVVFVLVGIALAGTVVSLKRPTVVNATIEIVTGGAAASALTSESPATARLGNAFRVIAFLVLTLGLTSFLLLYTGYWKKAFKSKAAWYMLIASLMILSITNYLLPQFLPLIVQIVIVAGIWVISQLYDTKTDTGKKILAWTLGICLLGLGIDSLRRPGGPVGNWWDGVNTTSAEAAEVKVNAAEPKVQPPKTYIAPVRGPMEDGWSEWHERVIPPTCTATFKSSGLLEIQTYVPITAFVYENGEKKEIKMPNPITDGPGITQPVFNIDNENKAMWRFRSKTGKNETFRVFPTSS